MSISVSFNTAWRYASKVTREYLFSKRENLNNVLQKFSTTFESTSVKRYGIRHYFFPEFFKILSRKIESYEGGWRKTYELPTRVTCVKVKF